jgi:transcriptional regulator with XRE-family HTH domain
LETAKKLGRRIKQLRQAKEFTQAELAEETGLSNNFIALLERGRTTPSLKTLEAIAGALDVERAELFRFQVTSSGKKDRKELAIQKLLRKRKPSQLRVLLEIEKLIEKMAR